MLNLLFLCTGFYVARNGSVEMAAQEYGQEEEHCGQDVVEHSTVADRAGHAAQEDDAAAGADVEHVVIGSTGIAAPFCWDGIEEPRHERWHDEAGAETVEDGGRQEDRQGVGQEDDDQGNCVAEDAWQHDPEGALGIVETAAKGPAEEDEDRARDEEETCPADTGFIGQHGNEGIDAAVGDAKEHSQEGGESCPSFKEAVPQRRGTAVLWRPWHGTFGKSDFTAFSPSHSQQAGYGGESKEEGGIEARQKGDAQGWRYAHGYGISQAEIAYPFSAPR